MGHEPRSDAQSRVIGVRITHIGGPTALIEVDGWRCSPTRRSMPQAEGTPSAGHVVPEARRTGDRRIRPATDRRRAAKPRTPRRQPRPRRTGLIPSAGVVVTTVSGAKRLGSGARGLEPWATTRLEAPGRPSIETTATPCRDGPPLSHPLAGDVVGFRARWDGQGHGVLWISGDTVLYDGVRHVADCLQVDTALLHLGGVQFPITGPVRYTMTARDAVELCRIIRPRTAIPIHYEGWKQLPARPRSDRARAREGAGRHSPTHQMAAHRRPG